MEQDPFFTPAQVLLQANAQDKWELIDQMMETLTGSKAYQECAKVSPDVIREAVVEREKNRPTGLQDGFAFPHGRISGLQKTGLCIAICSNPLDFGAIDKQPCNIVALMVVAQDQPQVALRYMSQFARLLSDAVEREVFLSLRNAEALCEHINRRLLSTEHKVTARDIMRAPYMEIRPDTPLREVTRKMQEHTLDTVAVVEEDGTIVGEITCNQLFKLGMPDFFSQLKSISFISEFDPFERYFEGEGNALARDVMSTDFATVPEDATLLEVTFELAVKRHNKVYVARDGKRIGIIDRILVLDRVINI